MYQKCTYEFSLRAPIIFYSIVYHEKIANVFMATESEDDGGGGGGDAEMLF